MESWELEHHIEILKVRCKHLEKRENDILEIVKTFAGNMAMMSGQIESLEKEIKRLDERIDKLEKVIENVQT